MSNPEIFVVFIAALKVGDDFFDYVRSQGVAVCNIRPMIAVVGKMRSLPEKYFTLSSLSTKVMSKGKALHKGQFLEG